MNAEFRKSFEKDLKNIRNEALLQRIKTAIEEVENVENLADVGSIKKLKADCDYYLIRIGIAVYEDAVIFVRVLHRKDVYKYFP
ncbi:type II toxin-antitoxin system RelE family toxin [Nostoc sp. MG11]|uniref:type II toxin-antitoxin system RelE family toxin n=1 Tax=Nostoc sp. MG11 TaxID=2721166 RepID=UPI0018677478|nr:type II toxin-antitoxin system RelE/ParE family toxin [Nostoc sp. MG11]